MFGENTSVEMGASGTGYITPRSHFLEPMWEASVWLLVLCISDHPGLWAESPLLEVKLERETSSAGCFLPRLRILCYLDFFLRAVCGSMFEKECLLSTYCVPDIYICSFDLYIISKTSLWVVDTIFPLNR